MAFYLLGRYPYKVALKSRRAERQGNRAKYLLSPEQCKKAMVRAAYTKICSEIIPPINSFVI